MREVNCNSHVASAASFRSFRNPRSDLQLDSRIAFDSSGPVLRATWKPKAVHLAGERGVILGSRMAPSRRGYSGEAASHLTSKHAFRATPFHRREPAGSGDRGSSDHTVITFSHIASLCADHVFASTAEAGTDRCAVRIRLSASDDFTLRFTPELRWMCRNAMRGAGWSGLPDPALQAAPRPQRQSSRWGRAITFCIPIIRPGGRCHHPRRRAWHPRSLSGAPQVYPWSSTCTSTGADHGRLFRC